ncbi:BRO1-domain-containing protein [Boletus edulis BED1]|uniref:BRO domain-containing protein 1 n=1 Tax=Boletus edulis BED1 TaxID=1328754 RepID=A0AAD4C908_BOLED|nr:BRO1-domain-containing protein [Boletus edulis BED1]
MSSHQSPMISIPRKTAEEVDWTTPIRNLIAKSYGENPETYAQEYQALQRCRQDAVKGAGSDMTGRDLLYKYFGQLELLELRFSEIRVNFSWHDAFTNKVTMQTSIAYEKASVLFQIAATHSAIAASQNRSNPEGLRLAFHYFRSCAGMLSYINDNFLHAPSTDLSREVIKFLVGIVLAQATEVFLEKCTDEKKANSLIAKIASQAAFMYTSLSEEAKDFMGKGIFDRNWVTLIQIKSKFFGSLAQFYRAQVDSKAGNHGESLVRYTLAESLAKESHRTAQSFSALWAHVSPTLPADAGASILERTKSHLQVCTDRKNEAQRDNDLIYNAVLPSSDALPAIDKASVATPTTIQEVYSAPEVQKIIGPDIFIKLIPLSVHESASVYSEEKAKLVRKEVENAESAEVEVRSALEAMGVQEGLGRFKAMAEGGIDAEDEIPLEVRRWREDIGVMEDRESVDALTRELSRLKDAVKSELESISRELDGESRECESMRVKYDHLWTQEPSASLNKSLRQDLKSHLNALEAAATSDKQVFAIWDTVKGDISLMLSSGLEELFRASVQRGGTESLLDLEISWETHDEQERAQIGQHTTEIEERLGRIKKIAYERNEVLKDLKEKIQADDVSHLLLLNRRNNNVEPALFAAELEKFRPYQQRLAATVHHQQIALQEIQSVWKSLRDTAGRGPGAKKWEEREKRKKDAIRRISRSRDGYMEVRDGLTKGLQFYNQLTELSSTLSRNVQSFVSERRLERGKLAGQAEVQQRLSSPQAPPPVEAKPRVPPPPRSQPSIEASFASMNLQSGTSRPSPPAKPPQQTSYTALVPPAQPQRPVSYLPPPPPQLPRSSYADPYSSLGQFGSPSLSPRPSIPPPPPQRQSTFPPPPPPPQSQPSRQYTSSEYVTSTTYPAPPPPMQYSFPPPLSSTPPRASTQYQPPPPPPQGYTQYHQGYRQ